ncbi:hypothetical protein XENTR_v10016387 [Xenopus tropicalis]|uniref:ITPR interacting domain containing 1 n=1 Tax=Xenopus tropicalis TaxID=8364 RepID=A0A6I8R1G9_XENTR|nr:protein ITPRID1 [Xenopus tropicalis]XP_031759705.1 protein ITPRID1 [Xenopus tropicalis]XP_031759706.1 protein ITPRID1 [Xenopus tropicalis]KAE8597214.1 hypothetical protein XENTR_v10016387 [Xenopus tropicalis]KAE8597215.1 hypothetical protein XENTR_v10016387 [Xenopus tropicalis]
MALSGFTSPKDSICKPDVHNVKQAGPMFKMETTNISVKDFMSSLNNYLETPLTSKQEASVNCAFTFPTSIRQLLQLYEVDPIDLLLDLGFGVDEPDICTKIPSRFIMSPSGARGINIHVFLEAQKQRMDIECPNLCGRFRQLEVLEQVTSAFSSLLKDVNLANSVQDGGKGEVMLTRKSALTQEKRKRVCQLLCKFAKEARGNEASSGCLDKEESCKVQVDENESFKETSGKKVFRKTRKRCHDTGKAMLLTNGGKKEENKINVLTQRKENQQCSPLQSSVPAPSKQWSTSSDMPRMNRPYKSLRTRSKSLRNAAALRIQPPDSFELEEVQSFEEEYPRAFNYDSISEITRTNSCQSDSSGFQEEPLEAFHLKNLTKSFSLSSDRNDSDATVIEEKYCQEHFNESNDMSHSTSDKEYENCSTLPPDGKNQMNKGERTLSKSSKNSDDVFESFESASDCFFKDVNNDNDKKDHLPQKDEIKTESAHEDEKIPRESQEEHQVDTFSEAEYPVYITHYLRKDIENDNKPSVVTQQQMDNSNEWVSECPDTSNNIDQFADKCSETSLELLDLKWTPPPIDNFLNPSSLMLPEGHDDFLDKESNYLYEDKKNVFQTEVNTNIYKSVTIQMSSDLKRDIQNTNMNAYLNKQHVLHTLTSGSIEDDVLEKKEACTQTEMGWQGEYSPNPHHFLHRCGFPTRSNSFDNGPFDLHLPCHQVMRACRHCCFCCCHHHHCCPSRYPSVYENPTLLRSNLTHTSMETELTDTLKMLRESLTNISLLSDYDSEYMKKACQRYREQLLEIEQHLTEQQAGWLNMYSSEEREEIRRLFLLRRNVLQEVSELEQHLNERAQHVKETISMQLEQVLEEQSKLYSDLGLTKRKKECDSFSQNDNPRGSFTLSASTNYENTEVENASSLDMENKNEEQTKPSKMDFSAILYNIKKTFRSFNSS